MLELSSRYLHHSRVTYRGNASFQNKPIVSWKFGGDWHRQITESVCILMIDFQLSFTVIRGNTQISQRTQIWWKPFLLVNDSESGIVMFLCKSNLEFLAELDTVYRDGTFEYWPKFFLQMFSIHGHKTDHYVPLVVFLLLNKRKDTYKMAIQYNTLSKRYENVGRRWKWLQL